MNAALRTLSIADVVTATGMSQDQVYRLIAEGKVNAGKVGRLWRVQEVSLLAWIEHSRAKTAPIENDEDEGERFGLSPEDQVFS